jgi:hypothetical protein
MVFKSEFSVEIDAEPPSGGSWSNGSSLTVAVEKGDSWRGVVACSSESEDLGDT